MKMKKYFVLILLIITVGLSSSSCKKAAESPRVEAPGWQMDATGKYPYTMTAVVTFQGRLSVHIKNDDQLGAFIGGECRGIGSLQEVGGNPVYFVLIHGQAAEQQPVEFRYYSSFSSSIYYSDSNLIFSVDSNFGIADNPEVLVLKKQ